MHHDENKVVDVDNDDYHHMMMSHIIANKKEKIHTHTHTLCTRARVRQNRAPESRADN